MVVPQMQCYYTNLQTYTHILCTMSLWTHASSNFTYLIDRMICMLCRGYGCVPIAETKITLPIIFFYMTIVTST